MKEMMTMRTTINISDNVIKETQALYNTNNKSNAVENALKDAIRFKKLQMLMELKGKITFDEKSVEDLRRAEIDE
jgi:Arc/MetJ family transcription regulator